MLSGLGQSCSRFSLLPDPFLVMGPWRETREPEKPGQCCRSRLEVVYRGVSKERAAQGVGSRTEYGRKPHNLPINSFTAKLAFMRKLILAPSDLCFPYSFN